MDTYPKSSASFTLAGLTSCFSMLSCTMCNVVSGWCSRLPLASPLFPHFCVLTYREYDVKIDFPCSMRNVILRSFGCFTVHNSTFINVISPVVLQIITSQTTDCFYHHFLIHHFSSPKTSTLTHFRRRQIPVHGLEQSLTEDQHEDEHYHILRRSSGLSLFQSRQSGLRFGFQYLSHQQFRRILLWSAL